MNVKWHNRFINLALEVSNWSKDHKQVGCVIVDSDTKKVLSTGFNGMPTWFEDYNLDTLESYDRGRIITHAEENALNTLGEEHYNKNLVMYVTKPPCKWCSLLISKSLINIKQIYYIKNTNKEFDKKYNIEESVQILKNFNIKIEELSYIPDYTFEIVISQYFNYTEFDHEILVEDISNFIFHTKTLINNLDIHFQKDTSYIDSILWIIRFFGYKNLLEFSITTNSVKPELFLKWFNNHGS